MHAIFPTHFSLDMRKSTERICTVGKVNGATPTPKGHRRGCSSPCLWPLSPYVDKPWCLWRMASATPDLYSYLPSLRRYQIYTAWWQLAAHPIAYAPESTRPTFRAQARDRTQVGMLARPASTYLTVVRLEWAVTPILPTPCDNDSDFIHEQYVLALINAHLNKQLNAS